ncbi:MAG: hypothetical protein JRJ02_07875 [Deltaproteobacteria bacterium]|nr:hypothetical protein [Deltaproteobacteria bacterium]MBW1862277.1 hypothetical protein [Deltaproteobacteria bacterium]
MYRKYLTRFIFAAMVSTLILIFSGNGFAQPPWMNAPAGEMPKAFMEHEDGNGDGNVTREEYKGPDDHWNFFDKNQDGFITIDEAARPDNMPEMGAPPGGKGGPEGGAKGAKDASQTSAQMPAVAKPLYGKDFIKKFDFDKDGKVNHDEWEGIKPMTAYANNRWPEFDLNRDGFITLDEAPQPK